MKFLMMLVYLQKENALKDANLIWNVTLSNGMQLQQKTKSVNTFLLEEKLKLNHLQNTPVLHAMSRIGMSLNLRQVNWIWNNCSLLDLNGCQERDQHQKKKKEQKFLQLVTLNASAKKRLKKLEEVLGIQDNSNIGKQKDSNKNIASRMLKVMTRQTNNFAVNISQKCSMAKYWMMQLSTQSLSWIQSSDMQLLLQSIG